MDSMFKTKSKTKYLVDDEENIVNVVKVLLIIRLFVNNGWILVFLGAAEEDLY